MSSYKVYKIAGICIGLSDEIDLDYTEARHFQNFLSADNPHCNYRIQSVKPNLPPPNSLIFDSGQSWRIYQENDLWVIWVGSRECAPYLVGSFNQQFTSGDIYTSESSTEPGTFIFPLAYPLGGLLMSSLLGVGHGIMLHSCGIILKGEGLVFAGFSTAGKTTTARLWASTPSVNILNDDHTIIRKINNQFRVFGTPWPGATGSSISIEVPLKCIFTIKHATRNQAHRLSPGRAAVELMARSFYPLCSKSGVDNTLEFLGDLCQNIPVFELGFLPDRSAVEYVHQLVDGS